MGNKILVVDDAEDILDMLSMKLTRARFEVSTCNTGEKARKLIRNDFDFDLVLTDVVLPDLSGIELLKEIKQEYANCQVIVMTGQPSLKLGVESIKLGAFDFVCKPFDLAQLVQIVRNALENVNLKHENLLLRQSLKAPTGVSDMIGKSREMDAIREMIRQAAKSRANVLILGESGTGKEIVAQTIHTNSLLHENPMVAVNCGAIPDSLLESELFGYEKGAFTNAHKQTKGKFEQAENSTIFLDEIGELPLNAQVKILRVLQDKEIVRLGGSQTIKLNIRVIAATNRDLLELVRERKFRVDLYYRIALFVIELPRLNDRGDDVVLIANHFTKKFAAMEGNEPVRLDPDAEDYMREIQWPGNVRQLENCIHRTILMNPGKSIITREDIRHLPDNSKPVINGDELFHHDQIIPLRLLESKAIKAALQHTSGNVQQASQQLGLSRVTMYRKMKELGLNKKSFLSKTDSV